MNPFTTDTRARLSALVEKLRANGHRITPQRVAILQAVLEDSTHPTVDQIYTQVRQQYPMTSLATVYKTVALLKDEHPSMDFSLGGVTRIDGSSEQPHPHLVCIRCQQVIDLEPLPGSGLPDSLAQEHGFEMIENRVDYYGLCPACQSAKAG